MPWKTARDRVEAPALTYSSSGDPQEAGRVARLYAATRRPPSPRVQRALLAVAAAVFIVGGWYAFRSLDVAFDDVRWLPLVLAAVVGVPLSLLANTLEYVVSARILHHRVALLPAVQLTTMSTAANLLPIPGAFLVRVQGLRALGSRYDKAAASTAVIGLVWIGVSASLAAIFLAVYDSWLAAAVFAVLAVSLLLAAYTWLTRTLTALGERRRIAAAAVTVELFAVGVDAGRLVLILVGLGVDASLGQAMVLAVASSLAAAAGILPGGFGLRELIAALLAPLVGLAASAAFAATALNRVLGLIVMAPITAALALRPRPAPSVQRNEEA
jgi:uncharacterized membrane protein YbhN (UPF0104 family)